MMSMLMMLNDADVDDEEEEEDDDDDDDDDKDDAVEKNTILLSVSIQRSHPIAHLHSTASISS